MGKKHTNGKHVILVVDSLKQTAEYERATRAVQRATTRSNGFKSMRKTQMLAVINAALKDCFEPLPRSTIRRKGDHLSQTLGRMGSHERQIQIKDA